MKLFSYIVPVLGTKLASSVYADKAYYKGQELVGSAVGHYAGYDGEKNFEWTSATIAAEGDDFIDISFSSTVGDLHWVVFDGLAGSYQYLVNRGLPDLSIVRTLWRLDPELFLNGRTYLRDQPLPDFALYANATKVQDETWELADGTFITKYDFSDYVRDRDFYGIYGPKVGSWYIHPGKDYYNSNQLSQTLTVHRESATGDSVQLNVVQDTSHFRLGNATPQPKGKIWGPWLWYLNDGSVEDVERQRQLELQNWPYSWLNDTAYQSRGELVGLLKLSDGRPASGAAVYLGDVNATTRPLVQGSNYYYTTYANENGEFSFADVRTGDYALYAWSYGGVLADVYSNFSRSAVSISEGKKLDLGSLTWAIPEGRRPIFQIGDFDKKALGFTNGGPPYRHGVADQSPANLTYTIGVSNASDWYYAQSLIGTWTIEFELSALDISSHANSTAILSISLAGYSQSAALDLDINGQHLATWSKDTLASDPALYRSGKISGEWRFFQYEVNSGVLHEGTNTVGFTVTRYTQWRGFMWDSVILEWA
ncbi:hypothetical protein JX265_010884 [Neoarthrinium moseri]|uniref:rhamnogalacturonan endolyase n=1 Tax=Neoarthrinium moseri TaxID=1658444 RepID=A0A9P9WDI6_9PEZI|nr:hypothetical protein JX265_010884 [Neoarthrinium moseri]